MARNKTIGFRPDDEELAELVKRADESNSTPGLIVAEIVREKLIGMRSERLTMEATIRAAEERGVRSERARNASRLAAEKAASQSEGYEAGRRKAFEAFPLRCLMCDLQLTFNLVTNDTFRQAVEYALAPWCYHDNGPCTEALITLLAKTGMKQDVFLRKAVLGKRYRITGFTDQITGEPTEP